MFGSNGESVWAAVSTLVQLLNPAMNMFLMFRKELCFWIFIPCTIYLFLRSSETETHKEITCTNDIIHIQKYFHYHYIIFYICYQILHPSFLSIRPECV